MQRNRLFTATVTLPSLKEIILKNKLFQKLKMSDKLALARIKRLQKEMEKFETDPPPGCEASMTDPMTIKAKIKGVGPYDGGTYQFKITIPKVLFETWLL